MENYQQGNSCLASLRTSICGAKHFSGIPIYPYLFLAHYKAPDYLPNKEERGKKHLAEFSKQFCQLEAGRTDQCPLPLCCGIGCHVQCNIIYIWRRGLRSEIIK